MNRRGFLTNVLAGAVAVIGARAIEAPVVEAAECADCTRVFTAAPMPEMFAKPWPEMVNLARQATHEKALREGIRHDEAAMATYLLGFPEVRIETTAIADARGESYADGYTQGRQAERSVADLPPTFERMQADCERRGCRLENWISGDGRTIPTHIGERIEGWGEGGTLTPYGLAQVDAWRRSLHVQSDVGQIAAILTGERPGPSIIFTDTVSNRVIVGAGTPI